MMSSCTSSPMISTVASGINYMQDINSGNRTTVLGDLTQDETYQIKDNRDDTTYCVSKLADGNLWMLDNLALDISSNISKINATNTNINGQNETENTAILTSLREGNRTAGDQYATSGVSTIWLSDSNSIPLYNLVDRDTVPSDTTSQNGNYKIGGYYNFCATTAGSFCFGEGASAGIPSGTVTSSICPKGWRLPTGSSSGEYQVLYSNTSYNSVTKYRSALHLPLPGYYSNNSVNNQGSKGFWWSSTRYSNLSIYNMDASIYQIRPGNSFNTCDSRYCGNTIRCILDL